MPAGDELVQNRVFLLIAVAVAVVSACGNTTSPADTVDIVSDTGPLECPEGLVLWEEYNVCAPRVDDCENPWELPLIGGGCVAIGPRACPKLWDLEADEECEPGELTQYDGSACREGFVLTDDESACVPYFEENCGPQAQRVMRRGRTGRPGVVRGGSPG